ncbi:RNA-directed DNA polymerase, eukaryota [Tanacetum coccineum]
MYSVKKDLLIISVLFGLVVLDSIANIGSILKTPMTKLVGKISETIDSSREMNVVMSMKVDDALFGRTMGYVIKATNEFEVDGRIAWVEVEGNSIREDFKITHRGKMYWIRANETQGWVPEFTDEYESEDDNSMDEEGEVKKNGIKDEHSDGEIVPESLFEDGELENNHVDGIFSKKEKEVSEDPFNLYSLLKRQNKLDDKDTNSEDSLKHPPGSANGSISAGHFKVSEIPRTGGSMVGLLEDVIKVGQVMGFKMEGVIANLEELIGTQGGKEGKWRLTGKNMMIIGVYAPQEGKEKQALWDFLRFEVDKWNGDVIIMGDFNEGWMSLYFGVIVRTNDEQVDRFLGSESVLVKPDIKSLYIGEVLVGIILAYSLKKMVTDYGPTPFRKFGFGDKWRKWIQCCLHSSKGSIIINGSPTDEFQFGRGLKQGDSVYSPFLFLLIMESLHISFQRVVDAGMFHGIDVGGLVNLSHMFYADDAVLKSILFAKAKKSWRLVQLIMTAIKMEDENVTIGGEALVNQIVIGRGYVKMSCFKVPGRCHSNLEISSKYIFIGYETSERRAGTHSSEALAEKVINCGAYSVSWIHVLDIETILVVINVASSRYMIDARFLPKGDLKTRRGIDIESLSCVNCDVGIETNDHLFFACNTAKKISKLINRWWDVPFMDINSYGEWRSWIDKWLKTLRRRIEAVPKVFIL